MTDIHNKSIECGPGWLKLITACHSEMLKLDPNYKVRQVKEKFGGLRFYFDPQTYDKDTILKMYEVVSRYEKMSLNYCEKCGSTPAKQVRNKNGWIKTYCNDHSN